MSLKENTVYEIWNIATNDLVIVSTSSSRHLSAILVAISGELLWDKTYFN